MVGIFGNLLTILALVKCPKVRNVAAAFIIRWVGFYCILKMEPKIFLHSLCLADCIFCAFVLPFNALRFIKGALEHKGILCRLIPLMQYGNIGVSLLCIAMITINRYSYNIARKMWVNIDYPHFFLSEDSNLNKNLFQIRDDCSSFSLRKDLQEPLDRTDDSFLLAVCLRDANADILQSVGSLWLRW